MCEKHRADPTPSEKRYKRQPSQTGREAVITQDALPSERESVEGHGVGVVSHDDGEGLLLVCELQALGDGVVKGNRLIERHGGTARMVSLVDTAT